MTNLSRKFDNLYNKANNINSVLGTWNVLVSYEEFNANMAKSFIKILELLQDDLISDIDNLNNSFLAL